MIAFYFRFVHISISFSESRKDDKAMAKDQLYGIQMDEALKDRLIAAAHRAERSLHKEVVYHLRKSLEKEATENGAA